MGILSALDWWIGSCSGCHGESVSESRLSGGLLKEVVLNSRIGFAMLQLSISAIPELL